jgi:hypothetical protein
LSDTNVAPTLTPHAVHTQAVLESTVVVKVCLGGQPCGAETSEALQMNLTTPITDADAKAIFSPLSGVKILEFTSMLGVVSGFAEDADRERFYRRVRDYAGIWCCIQAHPVRALRVRQVTRTCLTPAVLAGPHMVRLAVRRATHRPAQQSVQRLSVPAAHGSVSSAAALQPILACACQLK